MEDLKKKSTVRAGFTLVELVVVIAILGILAGVAYPAYTGYIKRAQDAKVESKLSNVLVTVQSAMAMSDFTEAPGAIKIPKSGPIVIYTNAKGTEVLTTDVNELSTLYSNLHVLAEDTFGADGAVNLGTLQGTSFADDGGATKDIFWTSYNEKWSTTDPSTDTSIPAT